MLKYLLRIEFIAICACVGGFLLSIILEQIPMGSIFFAVGTGLVLYSIIMTLALAIIEKRSTREVSASSKLSKLLLVHFIVIGLCIVGYILVNYVIAPWALNHYHDPDFGLPTPMYADGVRVETVITTRKTTAITVFLLLGFTTIAGVFITATSKFFISRRKNLVL